MPASTHCPYCALQCSMSVSPSGEVAAGVGGLCRKGWTSADLLRSPERLTSPLVRDRKGGPLRRATWDEALDRVVAGVLAAQEGGRDKVAVFGGGGLTNEKCYALGKFARVVLRTSQIDYNGRFCMSSAAAAGNRAFGVDRGMPFPLGDLAEADCVMLIGSNPGETMPPFMQHLQDVASLIVVDPRRTATADAAALHLAPQPGSDLALANGMLFVALDESLVDRDYVASRTPGFAEVNALVSTWWPSRVERLTGVSEPELRRAVRMLAGADRAMILTARGAEQHAHGVATATAWINLALALGLPGTPGSGWGTLTGQGNGQGGREHGQKADQLPGYRSIKDPAARAHVAAVWGVDPDSIPGAGVSAYELLDSLGDGGGPSAMLLFASNPVVSAPNARNVAHRLQSLDFLMVSDLVLSETAALADGVLPCVAATGGTLAGRSGSIEGPPPADAQERYALATR